MILLHLFVHTVVTAALTAAGEALAKYLAAQQQQKPAS